MNLCNEAQRFVRPVIYLRDRTQTQQSSYARNLVFPLLCGRHERDTAVSVVMTSVTVNSRP